MVSSIYKQLSLIIQSNQNQNFMGTTISKLKIVSQDGDDSDQDTLSLDQKHSFTGSFHPKEVSINQMNQEIHQQIGALVSINKQNKKFNYGTGVLISPNLVLTVAHNVFDLKERKQYDEIRFYPGLRGTLQNPYEIQSWYYPRTFRIDPNTHNDFAIMKLKQKTTEYKDILPLSFHINYIGKDGALMIAGYPEIHYNRVASLGHLKESTSQYMYVKSNCIEKVSQKKGEIVYTCPAWKGQDGGPVIGIDAYKRITIVGIHRGGVRANGRIVANVGRLVTEELIKTLQQQTSKLGAQQFTTKFIHVYELMSPKSHIPHQDEITHYKNQYVKLMNSQKWAQALQVLLKLDKITPENPDVHYKIGLMHFNLQKYSQAVKHFRLCQKKIGKDFNICYMIGGALYMINHYNEASLYLQQALKLQPKNSDADVYLALGRVYREMNQNKEAEKWLEKSVEAFPKQVQSYLRLAMLKQGQNKFQEAQSYLLKAVEKAPTNEIVLNTLKSNYELSGNTQEGIIFFKKLVVMNTQNIKAVDIVGELYRKINKIQEGLQFLNKYVEQHQHLGNHPQINNIMSKLLLQAGRMNEVTDYIVKSGKKPEQVYYEWGVEFFKQGKLQKSQECFKKILQNDPVNQRAYQKLLAINICKQDFQQTVNISAKAIKMFPNNFICWLSLAQGQLKTSKVQQAQISFKKAIEINPNRYEGIIALGDYYTNVNQSQKALECYLQGQKKGCKSQDLLTAVGASYIKLGKVDEGLKYLKKSLFLNPNKVETLTAIGNYHFLNMEFQQAERFLIKAQEIGSNDLKCIQQCNYLLATIYSQTQRVQQAVQRLEKCIELNIITVQIFLYLGMAYNNLKKFDKAIQILNKAIELDPSNQTAWFFLSVAEVITDHREEGEKIMMKLYREGYQSWQMLTMLGVLKLDNQPEKSVYYFKKSLQTSPQNVESIYGLGRAYECIGDVQKTEGYYSTVKELENEDNDKISKITKFREQMQSILKRDQ